MSVSDAQCSAVLEAAKEAEIGIRVWAEGGSALQIKQLLYNYRKSLGDEAYADLEIALAPDNPDRRVWIFHKAAMPGREPLPTSSSSNEDRGITF